MRGIWEASARHLERLGRLLEALLGLRRSRVVLEQKKPHCFVSQGGGGEHFPVDEGVVTITVYCA
jgi:hypothetical protein